MSISRKEFLEFLKATCSVAALPGSLHGSAPTRQLQSALAPTADTSEAVETLTRGSLQTSSLIFP